MDYFEHLGLSISTRWKRLDYDEERFPEVALAGLTALPPSDHVDFREIAHWALDIEHLPHQADIDAEFGNPPLTVYNGKGFRIDVLFWIEGVPSIHQHGFSGAFHVLRGSSTHTLWTFEPSKRIQMRLLLGQASLQSAEVLKKGDSRIILAGSRMFHATYHIDRPSVSIVVRTTSEADKLPQYTLWPPTIATVSYDLNPTVKRQMQIAKMLLHAGRREQFRELTRRLVSTKDSYWVFQLLHSTFGMVEDEEERAELLLTASTKHPDLVRALQDVLVRNQASERIQRILHLTTVRDLRFFLALIRNVPDGATILHLIGREYPSRTPIDSVLTWVRRLSDLGVLGLRLHDAWFDVLRHLLHSGGQISYPTYTSVTAPYQCLNESDFGEVAIALESSWLLRSLFERQPCPSANETAAPDAGPSPCNVTAIGAASR
jgi:hypothetical protein